MICSASTVVRFRAIVGQRIWESYFINLQFCIDKDVPMRKRSSRANNCVTLDRAFERLRRSVIHYGFATLNSFLC